MSYGFELRNKNDEIILSTEQPFPLLVPASSTGGSSSYGATVPSVGAGQVLFARTQNNETGVITTRSDSYVDNGVVKYRTVFAGETAEEQYWGAAPGVKTLVANRVSNVLTSPATSGYGFECYDTSGNVLFSTELTNIMKVEAVARLGFGETLVFENDSNIGSFNDLYVMVQPIVFSANQSDIFANLFDANAPELITGFWAHFDNTDEKITFVATGAADTTSNSGPQWDTLANFREVNSFTFGPYRNVGQPYIAVVARKI